MKNIPTAEEFLIQACIKGGFKINPDVSSVFLEVIKEYTQLHVTNALEEASVKAKTESEMIFNLACGDNPEYKKVVDRKSILNAYPLDNIK